MADPAQTALLPHISTPSAPDAGKVALYAKSDGNLYYRNTGGNEVLVTPYTLVSNSATPSTIAERTSFGDLYTGRLVLAHPNASQNTAVGSVSNLLNATGSSNTAIGFSSSNSITTGDWNTAVGTLSLVSNQTGAYNTVIGTQAGYNTTGSNNVFLGYNAAFSVTTGSNLICLGSTAQTSSATATNEITLGNSSIARFRIPGLYIDWTNGTTVWTNTNDGSGSGLDADLLDGSDSSAFVKNVQSVQVLTYAQGGTTYLNLTQGTTTCFSLTANGTGTTISHQNTPASGRVSFELHLDWTAGTISWPANWNKGMTPPTSTGEYIIQGVTINGGSNWTINVIYQ